jgi:hypothetical protein
MFGKNITVHPSAEQFYEGVPIHASDDPVAYVDMVLKEVFIPFIQELSECGWDCTDKKFQKDFASLMEITKAMLYRQHGLEHPIQKALEGVTE